MAQNRFHRGIDDFDPRPWPPVDGGDVCFGNAEEYLMDRDLDLSIRRCRDVKRSMNVIVVGVPAEVFGEAKPTRFPTEPPEGAVLKWNKAFDSRPDVIYTYVALRVGDKWYLTGNRIAGIAWGELIELIGNCPCELAIDWAVIPQLEPDPSEDMSPAQWYALHVEGRES